MEGFDLGCGRGVSQVSDSKPFNRRFIGEVYGQEC